MAEDEDEILKDKTSEEELPKVHEERDEVKKVEMDKESEDVIMQNIDQDNEYTTYHIHMVKEGETVETICTMYNSNMSLLMDYNDLSNLTPGEKILIPSENE